jgi:hypothetical protein
MRGFPGLGGTVDFTADALLAHIREEQETPGFDRMIEIWDYLSDTKHVCQGIQDRNTLPPATLDHPIKVTMGSRG